MVNAPKTLGKIVALFLVLAFCFSGYALSLAASAEESKPIVVIAGSDFQANTREDGIANVKAILSSIKAEGFDDAFGLLFCGDYNNEYDAKTEDIKALKEAVKSEFSGMQDENMVFVQGNHDPSSSKGLSKSGENDNDNYGVFVINEDDYMWYNDNEARIKLTAQKLDQYLKEKSESGYKKPIFVASHLALNYSKRTRNSGDGKYARYLVDVLNKYGDKLNIVFLFGHNHNNRFDDYIGGSNVFLAKGDTMFVSKLGNEQATPDACTLGFTYLNAGYLGNVYCLNGENSMTVFIIEGDRVTVKRVGINGATALKTKGAWATNLSETSKDFGTTNDYLNFEYPDTEYIGHGRTEKNVTVLTSDITKLTVTEDMSNRIDGFHTAYVGYKLEGEGYVNGTRATVKLELPKEFTKNRPVFVRLENGERFATNAVNGRIVYTAETLGAIELYQTADVYVEGVKTKIYLLDTQFSNGKNSLIVSGGASGKAFALTCDKDGKLSSAQVEVKSGFGSVYVSEPDESAKWHFINDTDFGYASVIGDLKGLLSQKLLVAPEGAELDTGVEIDADYTAWRVASNQFGIYTLEDNGHDERYYLKYDDGFYISTDTDTTKRVYLYTEKSITVKTNAYPEGISGSVKAGADGEEKLGSRIYLVSTDGRTEFVEATVSMLKDANGNPVSTEKGGTYNGLSLYYNDVEIASGYTLTVDSDSGSDSDSDGGFAVWIYVGAAVIAAAAVVAIVVMKRKKKQNIG